MTGRCLFCGGDRGAPEHARTCDGRQGAVEATLPDPATVNGARDTAMAQVAAHATERRPEFLDQARAFVERYLDEHGPTAGEVLTMQCKAAGIVPHDDRAFGPVYMGLARRGRIARVGTVRRERGHGTAGGNVWARPWDQAATR